MATVKKSKKKIIIPICIVLVAVIIVGIVFGVSKSGGGKEVSLYTVAADDITESVSLTGSVVSGSSKEYKVGSVATVKEVFVKVGDKVKEGDILATFDVTQLDAQIKSLQESYDKALSSYNSAVATQKDAKVKSDALAKEIAALENKIAGLQSDIGEAATATTAPKTTAKTTAKATTAPITKPTTNSTTASTTASTTRPSTGDPLLDFQLAIDDLNATLASLQKDISALTQTTQIIAETITQLAGKLDNDAIADRLVENLVASGIAQDMAEQIVASIDIEAMVEAITNSDNSQLTAAQIQLVALEGQYAIYKAQADGTAISAQKSAVDASKEALDILKAQKKEMDEGWKAAFDGTITAVDIAPGASATLLSSGITLENLDTVAVKLSLSEYDLQKVKVGMNAVVTTAFGTYDGEVTSIAPTATGGSSTSILDSVGSMAGISGLSSLTDSGAGVECIVTIPKADKNIVVGFDANVEIKTGEYNGVLVVPVESIKLEKGGTSFVYLYNEEESTVTKTQIKTGAASTSVYEVTEGLKAGDRIVSAPESNYEEDTFKVSIKK